MSTITHSRTTVPIAIYGFGALAELLFGYDNGIIGVSMLFLKKEMALSPGLQGLVVSSLLLGAAIGVGTAGRLADRFGRRLMLFMTGVVFALGGAGAYIAPDVWVLIGLRFMMGLGVGASASVVTVYLVEVAPTRHRGSIGSLGQLMVVLGIFLAFVVGFILAPFHAWRSMLGISSIPALILVIGSLFLPETPRWLLQQGRVAEARATLVRLGRSAGVDDELAEISLGVKQAGGEMTSRAVLRAMLSPALRRKLFGGIGLAVLVSLVGTNSIIYYAPSTLVHAGFHAGSAVAANVSIGITNVLFTLLGMFLIDRVGRRPMLMTGSACMATSMLVLSVVTASFGVSRLTAVVTLLSMLFFLASFASTWGVCVRVVVSELFPTSYRGSATGFVLVLNWLMNFCVSQIFPLLLERSAHITFLIFGAMGVFSLFFIWQVLPETAGRSLEEI